MDFLASCSYQDSQRFSGKLVVPSEDGGKPGKVYLNIVSETDDRSLVQLIKGNVKSVTYTGGMPSFAEEVFEDLPQGVFHEVPLSEFSVTDTPQYKGVVTLVRLPDGYNDMRYLHSICSQREDVRVIGGHLLGIEGVRVGRFDSGKDKLYPVYDGMYDSFLEVGISDLDNLTELVRKAKKPSSDKPKGSSKPRAGKKSSEDGNTPRKTNKIATSFSCLFSESDVEEF